MFLSLHGHMKNLFTLLVIALTQAGCLTAGMWSQATSESPDRMKSIDCIRSQDHTTVGLTVQYDSDARSNSICHVDLQSPPTGIRIIPITAAVTPKSVIDQLTKFQIHDIANCQLPTASSDLKRRHSISARPPLEYWQRGIVFDNSRYDSRLATLIVLLPNGNLAGPQDIQSTIPPGSIAIALPAQQSPTAGNKARNIAFATIATPVTFILDIFITPVLFFSHF